MTAADERPNSEELARRARAGDAAALAAAADADLVRLAQEGDTRAFDELVVRYRDKVYRLAVKILRHEDDAAEALQDAFLSAYRGLPRFKAESSFSTWLYRITTNASLMIYRRRRPGHLSLEQSQSQFEGSAPIAIPDWSAQPLEDLLTAETREAIEEGVRRLSEELRTVFILRDEVGHTNAEVAEMLELSVPAVKSRLHRARLSLREHLDRFFRGRAPKRGRGSG